MKKGFFLDTETNGLYGVAFAIGVTVREKGQEIARFEGRCPDDVVTDGFTRENVLPALSEMSVTHNEPEELEEAFWAFWLEHGADAAVIAHCASPVESGLFRRRVEVDPTPEGRMFKGPYPALHDVATLLLLLGEKADSVDAYIEKYDIHVPFKGTSHHPLYDAVAAAIVWEHASERLV